VRMHFWTLAARGYGALSVPTMYGMKGTIPAIVNRIEGSEDTSEALGTISWSFFAKKSSQRRWISEVRMGGGVLPWLPAGALRLGPGLHLDGRHRRHTEGRVIHQLAFGQDVAVHDGLTGLQGGAGEAGAQHERVQTHLQQLDHALTGQARLLLRVQVGAVQL